MENRQVGVIATVVTALLCGCPGLFSICFGAFFAAISFIPGAEIDVFGSSDPMAALVSGLGAFCVGIVFVAIPIAIGFFMLRKKPVESFVSDEPLPPAI